MRSRLLAAVVATALAASLAGQTAAAAGPRDFSGPALPDTASATAAGRAIDALARAQALFAEKSPAAARRQAATSGRDATMVLNDLRKARGDLKPAQRRQADALLARPTPDGDKVFGETVFYEDGEAPPVCDTNICVHYANGPDSDAPPTTDTTPENGIPDEVDRALQYAEQVHGTYVGAGYRSPDRDGGLGGGSNMIDVYLADVGAIALYGYCTTDEPPRGDGTSNVWSYCVIDDDFRSGQFPTNTPRENQQVTLAHEYFHAVQYAYDADEANWFLEATATWAEDEVYDSVNDNWNYLEYGQMGAPWLPLTTFGGIQGLTHYGNWIFFRYLTERHTAKSGGIPTLVREMMQRASNRAGQRDDTALQAIQKELKQRRSPLQKVYADFAIANRIPGKRYDEGRNYKAARPSVTLDLSSSKRSTGTFAGKIKHLANEPIRFKPGKGTAGKWKIRIKVNMQPKVTAPTAGLVVFKKNGKVASFKIKLNKKTKGSQVLAFSSRTVKQVDLVLINASPKSNRGRTTFSAQIFR
jgi:hypothetical protein